MFIEMSYDELLSTDGGIDWLKTFVGVAEIFIGVALISTGAGFIGGGVSIYIGIMKMTEGLEG